MVNPSFWFGKTILLTGHTGFKGGWLSLWLQSMGAHLIGYALPPPTNPSLFDVANISNGMTNIIGDIRDLEKLQNVFAKHQPEIIIHIAAQPLVRYSYQNPVETYSTNVMGTVHVLEAARQTQSVRVIINVTTDKCYDNREWPWGYRENEPLGGHDPYSNSKGCSELVTAAYRNSFFHPDKYQEHGVAIASARAGNVIGGGDWAEDRLIADIMRAITNKEALNIRNPNAIRPWQHVLEPLAGYLKLAQTLYEQGTGYAEAWNFGPNDEDAKPVQWIVEYLTQAWGKGTRWNLDNGSHPHEAHYLKLDCSKAKARLKWEPKWRLDMALDKIIDWQKHYQQGSDMKVVTLEQIAQYTNKLEF